jgi:hypothetical protein
MVSGLCLPAATECTCARDGLPPAADVIVPRITNWITRCSI